MSNKRILTMEQCLEAVEALAFRVAQVKWINRETLFVYGIPRGGVHTVNLLLPFLSKYFASVTFVTSPNEADLIVDDLVDSGKTMSRVLAGSEKLGAALFSKKRMDGVLTGEKVDPGTWLVFPWEEDEEGSGSDIPLRLLQYIGEDPSREGLQETPSRFLKAWTSWTCGYRQSPGEVLKVFEDGAKNYDELVLVKDIPVYSHCEHHLAPFFGVAHVGYIPNGKIVGLSKLPRLVDVFARRLQVQERLTTQIADALVEHLAPVGVGVVVECRHMCMESRGIQRQGATTTTSAMRGAIKDSDAARAEFLSLIKK